MTNEPCDMEQIQEEYEEAALSLLVNHIMQKEGRDLLEKSDELFRDPDYDYPVDLDKRAAKVIDRHFSSLRRRNALSSFKNAVTHVSRVFLFMFLIFSLTFTKVSAFRDATMNLAMKTFGQRMAIIGWDYTIDDSLSSQIPRWLPDGKWDISFYANDSNTVVTKYTRSDGAFININQCSPSFVLSIDIEDAEIRQNYLINGNSAVMSIKEEYIILSWIDNGLNVLYEVSVGGAPDVVDPAVVIKIAESLV